ncbi:pirin family protein [Sulfurospirillum multivorans]|uniref:Pirin domain-containing protein n=2 Tax=Sulfurospirillum multivorans TaxID=66821 RepID=A0AA86APQ2_SULMK|nr:pirin family protein [Sulfurospirillum multivorans]AHJ14149.1 pirin domain-containing protein [Sulfurospirillum multivorans DSM 12446]QEH07634.1 pirin domain-containing protein [Sulfurospirillum multivorans]
MSFIIHRANQRGAAEHGWLHSHFSFSFAEYYNPSRMGFGALRVINDDIVEAGEGFGMHPHRDMEIISIVTKGVLIHKDSFGNHGEVHAGEIQYMSAGEGVLHSEFASKDESAALFQIWIHPNQKGGKPLYNQRDFRDVTKSNQWVTLVSPDGADNSIAIKQDAFIATTELDEGKTISLAPSSPNRGKLVLVVEGEIKIDGATLETRDEVQITEEKAYEIKALKPSWVLVFDVPMH